MIKTKISIPIPSKPVVQYEILYTDLPFRLTQGDFVNPDIIDIPEGTFSSKDQFEIEKTLYKVNYVVVLKEEIGRAHV